MTTKVAFITGVTGQDGSYLSQLLIDKGYQVHGLLRRSSQYSRTRLSSLRGAEEDGQFQLHYGDVEDAAGLARLIRQIQPDEIYNLAAQSHVKVSFDIPDYTGAVTGLGAIKVLEAMRAVECNARFYQASSSEMFGSAPPPQNEQTPFHPRSPYAVAKVYAYWATVNYREAYGIFAANGILFNHESPLRGENFVTRKISRGVADIVHGRANQLRLGNLDARRDWGFAGDYVEGMWRMLQYHTPDDFVLATGESHSVRDFCELAFSRAGLNYRNHVVSDTKFTRPAEVDHLLGNPAKAQNELGWVNLVDFRGLVALMVDSDLGT